MNYLGINITRHVQGPFAEKYPSSDEGNQRGPERIGEMEGCTMVMHCSSSPS